VRRRLVVSTIAVVLVVLGALAVPVGIIVYRSAEAELRSRLQDELDAIVAILADADDAGQEPSPRAVLEVVGAGDGVRVTLPDGRVLADNVPEDLDETVTVSRETPSGATIELVADAAPLSDRFREQVFILLALAGGALLAAAALAAIQARQLVRPLERLATSAARLGDGDFSVIPLPTTGIPEIDDISGALRTSGTRVDRMLSTERHFTADATHQLRTGLTGIAMRFELLARHSDPEVVAEATAGLQQTDQLDETIDELLTLTRDGATRERTTFDLVSLVDAHVADWTPRFTAARRTLSVTTADPHLVVGTKGLAGQVVDILVDNALRHGRGTVTLHIEGPTVTVMDEGPGISEDAALTVFDAPVDPSAPHGRGLPLALRLARVDGGTVEIVTTRPMRVRFRLVKAVAPRVEPVRRTVPRGDELDADGRNRAGKTSHPLQGAGNPGGGERKET
jgi:signal transduction histidine kinase